MKSQLSQVLLKALPKFPETLQWYYSSKCYSYRKCVILKMGSGLENEMNGKTPYSLTTLLHATYEKIYVPRCHRASCVQCTI